MNIVIIAPIYRQLPHLQRFLDSVCWQLKLGDQLVLCCEQEEYNAIEIILASYRGYAGDVLLVANTAGVASCAAARNMALSRMSMKPPIDWVKFLDADDVLAPFALETFRQMKIPDQVQCIAGPQLKVVDGRVVGMGVPDWNVITRRNPAVPSMTFVRQSAVDKVGGFNPRICFEEDYDFWLRLRRDFGMGAFANVSWPVCYYWINQMERAAKAPVDHTYEGVDVREYFAREYAITPER